MLHIANGKVAPFVVRVRSYASNQQTDEKFGLINRYMLWPHKLIVGKIQQSGWCGEVHPNNSLPWDSFASVEQCNTSTKVGCLFNVLEGALHTDTCARVRHQCLVAISPNALTP